MSNHNHLDIYEYVNNLIGLYLYLEKAITEILMSGRMIPLAHLYLSDLVLQQLMTLLGGDLEIIKKMRAMSAQSASRVFDYINSPEYREHLKKQMEAREEKDETPKEPSKNDFTETLREIRNLPTKGQGQDADKILDDYLKQKKEKEEKDKKKSKDKKKKTDENSKEGNTGS